MVSPKEKRVFFFFSKKSPFEVDIDFWSDFDANLAPCWAQKSIKIRPEIDLKKHQNFDRFRDRIFSIFGANLAPIWLQLEAQDGPKSENVGPKSFGAAPKKRFGIRPSISRPFWTVLASILERPGVDFGTLDRPKTFPRRPTSIKNRSKLDPKMQELSRKQNQEQSLTHDYQKLETEWLRPPKLLLNHKSPKKNVGRR